MNIQFVVNPSIWYKSMYPSGIISLSSYLSRKGIENEIIDSKLSNKSLECSGIEKLIIDHIAKTKPNIVCFSASHIEFEEVTRLNDEIRLKMPEILTIVGGSQPTYRASDFLDNGFDFVCIGEGEKTLYEFVMESCKQNPQWGRIRGLAWRSDRGYEINEPRELLSEEELNEIGLPACDKLSRRYFKLSLGIIRGLPVKGALLLTTRGCPFRCSFCGCNKIFGKRLRFKSLENIEKEVRFLKEDYGIEGIWIVDDTFTVNREHLIGTSRILKKYDMIWGCQSRVNTIGRELIREMKSLGCVQIDFGVESGSQRILDDIIHKGTTIEQIERTFALTREAGIRTLANFMIGLPTETLLELEKTKDLAARIRADIYIFSIATPLPGTELYDMVNEEISPHQYNLLNWNGSELTEKLNKSEIRNIVEEKEKLEKKYFIKSIVKSVFSLFNLKFMIYRGDKFDRIAFVLKYIWKR